MSIVAKRYSVPGWGVGELWLRGPTVLAHDFRFGSAPDVARDGSNAAPAGSGGPILASSADSLAPSAAPLEGAHGPPSGTVAPNQSQEIRGFAPSSRQSTSPLAFDLARRFAAFLEGEDIDFADVELDLEWAAPFQRGLARALRSVPRGEVVSYGELAALAGRPRAARAAGAFCAANRFAFVVPCHRVVAANGIGGYGDTGLAVKRRLLALEGVEL